MRILALITVLSVGASGAYDLVTAGTVYAIDGNTQSVVGFETATGAENGSVPTPDLVSGADGLAASGTTLYLVNANGSNLIHRFDAVTGASVDAFPAPSLAGGGTDGLAFMDGFLYTLDSYSDTIFKVDMATGEVAGSCSTGLYAAGGLAAENGRLFAIAGLMSIVELDPDSCAVLGGPFAAPGGDFLLGLAFDGTWLYASTYISPAIHTMNPETGAVVDSFLPGFTPSGLASSAEAPATSVNVEVDFRPRHCANHLNLNSNATVAVMVLGTDALDVGEVDVASIRVEGLEPVRTAYRDRGTPGQCRGLPDGVLDLVVVMKADELLTALGDRGIPMLHGMRVSVQVEGLLHDGSGFAGRDDVLLKGNPIHATPRGDDPRGQKERKGPVGRGFGLR
jgi:hypothetical protein